MNWLGFSLFPSLRAGPADPWLFRASRVSGSVAATEPRLALTHRAAVGLKPQHSQALLYATGVFLENHLLQQSFLQKGTAGEVAPRCVCLFFSYASV